ncbi:MAG: hypothetical protein LDLANPLL_01996 [Turneriella sp.]|nr:hypothetical protein [Turneriella sp.]
MDKEGIRHTWESTLREEGIHIFEPGANLLALPNGVSLNTADKWVLIETLCDALCTRENLDSALTQKIKNEMHEREKLMSTGIGEQMAIPHAVIPAACHFMTECVIIKDGLDFESIDGSKAFIVVMLVAPKSALQEHLQIMASIARIFYEAPTREKFIAAQTASEALRIIRDAGKQFSADG